MREFFLCISLAVFTLIEPIGISYAKLVCGEDNQPIVNATFLADATRAVFGNPPEFSLASNLCVQVKLLSFPDADVLTAFFPECDAHACGGDVSAYVLQRKGSRIRVIRPILHAFKTGSWGNPGTMTAIRFAGNDGILLKDSYTAQGQTTSQISIYLFREGGLTAINQRPIVIDADNGAKDKNEEYISVQGDWFLVQNHLIVSYTVLSHGIGRVETVDYILRNNILAIEHGVVPPEIAILIGQ